MKLAKAWAADLSPTLRATVDERGQIILIRHGKETTVVNPSEARKLVDAWLEARKLVAP